MSTDPTEPSAADGNVSGSLSAGIASSQRDPLPRSSTRFSRDAFSTVFSLTGRQPWLKERQLQLFDLIDDCEKPEQQLLVCDLLQRFTFLDGIEFQNAIQRIADYIQSDLGLPPSEVAISASDKGRYADSAHLIVYSLKTANWLSSEWNTTSFIANLTGLIDSADKPNIVLVDEFIGTGDTALKLIKWLRERLSHTEYRPNIYFAVVAAMDAGIDRISAEVDGVFSAHRLQRGISDACPVEGLQDKIDAMRALESGLENQGRRGTLSKHSLGYKGSESLYSRANGNTPNNVFPIFWWERKADGTPRNTLLSCM